MLVVWTAEGPAARLVVELLVADLTAVQGQVHEKPANLKRGSQPDSGWQVYDMPTIQTHEFAGLLGEGLDDFAPLEKVPRFLPRFLIFSRATICLSGNDLICFLQGLPRRTRLLLTTPYSSLYLHCYNPHCVHDSKPDQSPENDVRAPFCGHA
jgi:hypothetical protein